MKAWGRPIAAVLVTLALLGAGRLLLRRGLYGLSLFVVAPVIIGALGACATHARSSFQGSAFGALAVSLASQLLFQLLLSLGFEGLVCVGITPKPSK